MTKVSEGPFILGILESVFFIIVRGLRSIILRGGEILFLYKINISNPTGLVSDHVK